MPLKRLERLSYFIKQAGWIWTFLYMVRFLQKRIMTLLESPMIKIEQSRFLIGDWTIAASRNTREWNEGYWNNWDWSKGGEEWTPSLDWKSGLVNNVMLKYAGQNSNILEIGPGSGRWTEYLLPLADRLILADVAPRCLELCRIRFKLYPNIEYLWTNGRQFDNISDDMIDFVWSYDCFVHINPTDTDFYLREIRRILKDSGVAVIHHAGTHYRDPNIRQLQIRSDVTKEFFSHLVTRNNLRLEAQLETSAHLPGDIISIIRK